MNWGINMTKVNRSLYIAAHSRNPRGKRTWGFKPGDGEGHMYSDVETGYAYDMSFSDAQVWAREHFSGYPEVYVLPVNDSNS